MSTTFVISLLSFLVKNLLSHQKYFANTPDKTSIMATVIARRRGWLWIMGMGYLFKGFSVVFFRIKSKIYPVFIYAFYNLHSVSKIN